MMVAKNAKFKDGVYGFIWEQDGTVGEIEYTLYISETDNSYYNQELIDENGNPVDDEDLLEQIMDEISDMPIRF